MDTAVDSIKERVPNRYSLVVLAAKRAKQLKEGAPSLIQTENTNCLTIALEEIAAGKIHYIEAPETEYDEKMVRMEAPAPVTPESAALQTLTQNIAEAEREAEAKESDSSSEAGEDGSKDNDLESAGLATSASTEVE